MSQLASADINATENEAESLEPSPILELALEAIEPDPGQPRSSIDEESLVGLIETIKSGGLLQPLVVRPHPSQEGKYLIVAGHRRYRAHQLAHIPSIRAIVRELSDQEALVMALIENTQREDLNPFDEAATYERLTTQYGVAQKDIALKLGKAPTVITETLKIGKLPSAIREEYPDYPVSKSVLILISRERSGKAQLELWERFKAIAPKERTVEALRELIQETKDKREGASSGKQIAQILSAMSGLRRFTLEDFHDNPYEYRKLISLHGRLTELIETLRQRFGEPPSEKELPPRARGRKRQEATAESPDTRPMEPA